LAAVTGLSARAISELESGRVRRPRKSTVTLLADAFGLSGAGREHFIRSRTDAINRAIQFYTFYQNMIRSRHAVRLVAQDGTEREVHLL
jgi:transcriptional regulator with XRE-family HTH domain